VSIYAPFRLLIAAAAALLIATVIASSSAHALLLGDAVAQSGLGAPLRVVIPIRAAPGESLDSTCVRLVPTAAGIGAPIVTGRVSLERAAATPRLIVTTPNAVNEPAVQFAIQAGCDGTTRRNYVLLLDPQAVSTAAVTRPSTAREPGQERPKTALSTARRSAETSPPGESRAAPRAVATDHPSAAVPVVAPPARVESAAASPAEFLQVSAPIQAAKPAPAAPRPPQVNDDQDNLWWYLAAPLAVIGALALGTFFVRRRRAALETPAWARGATRGGPRSLADPSAVLGTLSHLGVAPAPLTSSRTKPRTIVPSQMTAPRTLSRGSPATDVSTLDTLINTSEADLIEERAVRQAWATARSDAEREADGNAILQAIDAAERDLLFTPGPPAQAAMEYSLDDDLLSQPRRPDKAAA
jgi:hypothetical protein